MTTKDFESVLNNTILPNIDKLRNAGQAEYARDAEDIFANFKRVAKQLNISKEKALLTYFLKHIDGICSWVNGHKSQREEIEGRIGDAIVYLCLLWGMLEE